MPSNARSHLLKTCHHECPQTCNKQCQIANKIYQNEIPPKLAGCITCCLFCDETLQYFKHWTVCNNAAVLRIKALKIWSGSNTFKYVCVFQLLCISVCVCVCSNHDLTYANLTQRLIVLHKQCFFCLVDSTKESDLLTWWMQTKELLRCYFFCPVVTNLGSSNIPIAAFVLMKLAIQKLPFRDANNTDCWITIFKMTTITKNYESCRVVFNQRWRLSRIGK